MNSVEIRVTVVESSICCRTKLMSNLLLMKELTQRRIQGPMEIMGLIGGEDKEGNHSKHSRVDFHITSCTGKGRVAEQLVVVLLTREEFRDRVCGSRSTEWGRGLTSG